MTKRRRVGALALGGGLLALVLLAACGGSDEVVAPPGDPGTSKESTWKYSPNAVQAEDDLVNAVEVRDDSLVLPRSFESRTFEIGKVLFGRYADGFPDRNRYGFMRFVESVSVEGDALVLKTRQAALSDVFEDADIHFDSSTIAGNEMVPQGSTLNLLDDTNNPRPPVRTSGLTSINLSPTFGFDTGGTSYASPGGGTRTARGQMSLTFDVYLHPQVSLDFQTGIFRRTTLDVDFRVPFEFGLKACAALQGTYAWAPSPENTREFTRIPPIPLPGPMGLMLQVTPRVSCFPTIGGTVQAEIQSSVFGEPNTQFGYDRDWYLRGEAMSTIGSSRQASVILNGAGGPRCQLELRVGVYALGIVGAYFSYVPGVEHNLVGVGRFTTNQPPEGQLCERLKFTQRADIGVGASTWGITLADYSQTIWNGQDKMLYDSCREQNDCTGKQPGWYCSDEANREDTAYQCSTVGDGGISRGTGFNCPSGKFCQIAGEGRRAQMDGEFPACGDTAPPASNAHLDGLTCVSQQFPGFSVDAQ